MFDLARVAALLFAASACRTARYAIGAATALAIAALLAWEIGAPLAHHATGEPGPGSGFALVFLGPSAITPRVWMTLVEALLAAAASRVAFARARPLRPEGDAARAWDGAGLRFLFVACLDGLLVILDALLARLLRDA